MAVVDLSPFDLSPVAGLSLPPVGQLGFLVTDTDAELPMAAAKWGQRRWYRITPRRHSVRHRGTSIDLPLDIAVGYSGRHQIELLDAPGGKDNMYARHLASRGPGLHHLGFWVRDLDRRVGRAAELGFDVLQEGEFDAGFVGKVRYAYLDTQASCGIVLELIEVRSMGWRFGTSAEWMLRAFSRLGGAKRVTLPA